jgi:hypothetical protein
MAVFSVEAIKAGNEAAGQFYFSRDTMRMFKSRVLSEVFPTEDGALFITSERKDNGPRRYSVRRYFEADGSVENVGEFQAHRTIYQAKKAARSAQAEINASFEN